MSRGAHNDGSGKKKKKKQFPKWFPLSIWKVLSVPPPPIHLLDSQETQLIFLLSWLWHWRWFSHPTYQSIFLKILSALYPSTLAWHVTGSLFL